MIAFHEDVRQRRVSAYTPVACRCLLRPGSSTWEHNDTTLLCTPEAPDYAKHTSGGVSTCPAHSDDAHRLIAAAAASPVGHGGQHGKIFDAVEGKAVMR